MLDPFGKRAKALVKELGGINELLLRIPSYVGIDEVMERITWLKRGEVPPEIWGL